MYRPQKVRLKIELLEVGIFYGLNCQIKCNTLSKKPEIKSDRQVKGWIIAYREFGNEGLLRKRQNQSYTVLFKIAAKLYQTSELSYREAT